MGFPALDEVVVVVGGLGWVRRAGGWQENVKHHFLRSGCGSKPVVPFWGRCTTHFRTYFSGDWDFHQGYDLGFDPWPNVPDF